VVCTVCFVLILIRKSIRSPVPETPLGLDPLLELAVVRILVEDSLGVVDGVRLPPPRLGVLEEFAQRGEVLVLAFETDLVHPEVVAVAQEGVAVEGDGLGQVLDPGSMVLLLPCEDQMPVEFEQVAEEGLGIDPDGGGRDLDGQVVAEGGESGPQPGEGDPEDIGAVLLWLVGPEQPLDLLALLLVARMGEQVGDEVRGGLAAERDGVRAVVDTNVPEQLGVPEALGTGLGRRRLGLGFHGRLPNILAEDFRRNTTQH